MLSCDSVWMQFWKKSDDHTERRRDQTKHSLEASSISSVMNYNMFNFV